MAAMARGDSLLGLSLKHYVRATGFGPALEALWTKSFENKAHLRAFRVAGPADPSRLSSKDYQREHMQVRGCPRNLL
jgi:hypothetical protein